MLVTGFRSVALFTRLGRRFGGRNRRWRTPESACPTAASRHCAFSQPLA